MKKLLTAFWGRYGMITNKIRFKIISTLKDWIKMAYNDSIVIQSLDFQHKDLLMVFFSNNEKYHTEGNDVSEIIAAYVTCHARIILFRELIRLGDRVLYFDTDSIIFVDNIDKKEEYKPNLGFYLGEFKDELNEKWIKEFVCAGPKNYGYVLNDNTSKVLSKAFL